MIIPIHRSLMSPGHDPKQVRQSINMEIYHGTTRDNPVIHPGQWWSDAPGYSELYGESTIKANISDDANIKREHAMHPMHPVHRWPKEKVAEYIEEMRDEGVDIVTFRDLSKQFYLLINPDVITVESIERRDKSSDARESVSDAISRYKRDALTAKERRKNLGQEYSSPKTSPSYNPRRGRGRIN